MFWSSASWPQYSTVRKYKGCQCGLDGHLFEAVHNGSSVNPDRRVRLALDASCAVVVDLTSTERLAEQSRVGVADERRQTLDDCRHSVHRQRRVELKSTSSATPRARAQPRPRLSGVPRPRPLGVNEPEPGQVGASVTEVGEVQLVHRLWPEREKQTTTE